MRVAFADPVAALRRFHSVLDALCPEPSPAAETPWLRLAALAAVSDPGGVDEVAESVRATARRFVRTGVVPDASRFLAGAVLVRDGIPADAYASDAAAIQARLAADGVPADGVPAEMAVLALRLRAQTSAIALMEASRVQALHQRMRSRHWWVGVPEDLPASALLAGCHGSCEDIEAQVEAAYLALVEHGYAAGIHLHAAAALLPLTGLPGDRATSRFLGVAQAFRQFGPQRPAFAPALALLCLLDHEPEAIAEQFRAIDAHLASTLDGEAGHADDLVAAGLTFLDLAPFQRDGTVARARDARRRLTRDFHAALVALAPAAIVPTNQAEVDVLDD
jgi:hypothetical protein